MIDADKLAEDILRRCYNFEHQKELDAIFDLSATSTASFGAVAEANARWAADLKTLEK